MKKRMKQSKMSALIGGGSIILLVLVILLSIFNELSTIASEKTMDARYQMVNLAYQLRDGSQYLTNEVRAYSANGDTVHYNNYWNEVNTTKRRDKAIEQMESFGLEENEKAKIESVLALSNSLIPLEEQAMEAVSKGDNQKALDLMYGAEYTTGITNVSVMTEEFINMLSARCSAQADAAANRQKVVFTLTLFMILVVSITQIISIRITDRGIIRPVALISEVMTHISNGDLSFHLDMEPDTSEIGMLVYAVQRTQHTLAQYINEISHLLAEMAGGNLDLSIQNEYAGDFQAIKNAFEIILNNLNHTFAKISGTAYLVSDSAGRVSANAQTLAQGSTQQAASVDDLRSAMSTISSHVEQTAGNADQAERQVNGMGSQVDHCNSMMKEALDAMNDITQAANQIGTIIKTIDDIAFQTNILALNAAVEAARAGVAGKGFAVVADEVRALATKSAEAAKGTTELIDSAISSVKKGAHIVEEAANVIDDIVDGTKNVIGATGQITSAASAQAEELRDISEGMEQISIVVSTNSATAEESAAASEELFQQAATLKNLIERFRLREESLKHQHYILN